MPRRKRLIAIDCETDPFKEGRVPEPFLWGAYDGYEYKKFDNTDDFVVWLSQQYCIAVAHNGGKFDFIYLLKYTGETRVQIINGRLVKLKLGECELRDSFSIIPQALGSVQKVSIEYWKMEKEHRHEHMNEIENYLFHDCKYLYELVNEYRNVAGTQPTIASNALAFSKKLGVNPGRTNHTFDESLRRFYFGGRTECFQPGTHENLSVYDIKSSYPYAMLHDHATGADHQILSDIPDDFSKDEIDRCFIKLKCKSKGALPKRGDFSLDFPDDTEAHEFHVTGWEYNTALKHNLLSEIEILEVIRFPATINFRDYVLHWYEHKERHPKSVDPINYTIGKIMMNSLYGKLAQNPTKYYDYVMKEPGGECNAAEGWEIYTECFGRELHRRSTLWKYEYEYGKEWKSRPFYNNVATGASITGFARAYLLDAMHTVGHAYCIYCDTDSLVFHNNADLSTLKCGKNLGDWDLEGRGTVGHFAGKKLYAIKLDDGEEKTASKGSKLSFAQIEKVAKGETVLWQNDAPTFSLANGVNFVKREIRATAPLPQLKTEHLL